MRLEKIILLLMVLLTLYVLLPAKLSANCSQSCTGTAAERARCIAEGGNCAVVTPDSIRPQPAPAAVSDPDPVPVAPPVVETPQVSRPAAEPPARAPLPATQVRPQAPQIRPQVVRRPAPAPRPIITCSHDGLRYFPSQKRYECSEPRQRGSCGVNAGYGVPYICGENGNWGVSNDGLAECAISCAPADPTGDSCMVREKREDGQGDVCYSGTGAVGVNNPSCRHSYEPVECPVTPEDQARIIPQNDECQGNITYSCGQEGVEMTTSWSITERLGENTCNVYIRDEFGDHVLSHECNSSWSGVQIPEGEKFLAGGTYQLFISNGVQGCYNQLASETQLSCEKAEEAKEEIQGLMKPVFEWLDGWF